MAFYTRSHKIISILKIIFLSKELEPDSTVRNFLIVQIEGNRKNQRNIDHYNLDMIISIGYRANSQINNAFKEWKLNSGSFVKEYLTVQSGASKIDNRSNLIYD